MIPPEEPWPDHGLLEPSDHDAGAEAGPDRGRLKKSPLAFRTISEVADDLHVPQHVLRFWETRFPQVKPLKRGGGRRYYRPDDVALLRRISDLLYIQGYTIKGVQRLLIEGNGALPNEIPPADTLDPDGLASVEQAFAKPDTILSGTGSTQPVDFTNDAQLRETFRATLTEILDGLEAIRRQLPH